MLSERRLSYLSVPPQQQSSMNPFEPLQLATTAGSMQATAASPMASVLVYMMSYLRLEDFELIRYVPNVALSCSETLRLQVAGCGFKTTEMGGIVLVFMFFREEHSDTTKIMHTKPVRLLARQ